MKQAGKRICSLLLTVIMLFGIFPTTPKADAAMPSENAATVKSISVTDITDGSAPFDEDIAAGNDIGPNNKIVHFIHCTHVGLCATIKMSRITRQASLFDTNH